ESEVLLRRCVPRGPAGLAVGFVGRSGHSHPFRCIHHARIPVGTPISSSARYSPPDVLNPKNATFIPNALEPMAMGRVIVTMTVRTLITSLARFDAEVACHSIRLPATSRY